jgi:hypothetical protein
VLIALLAGQDTPQATAWQGTSESLYTRSLLASLNEISKRWGNIDDSLSGNRMRTDWNNVTVGKFPEITDDMPTRLEEFRIEYADLPALVDRYKRLRKEFSLLVAHPMTTEGSRLKVSYSISWFKYEKGNASYGLSAWSIVYFKYDTNTRQFVVDEVKLGGI